ncbi:MAG: portal protein [Chloroflexi bacterium RBG_13_51_18]|nr:MAG: portal protein [Chloroflexi bacterium RBG_13_51_18]
MNEAVILQLARMELDRIKGYKELLDFYYGRQWEAKSRRNERRLTFNYAKVFIEKVTSYLMGGMTFAVDPDEDSDEARDNARRAEAALKKVYSENYLEQLDLETEIDCAVLGDACYKVTWDAAGKRVRVTAPDAQGVYAWSSGDDASRLWRVAARYQLSREEVDYLYGVKSKNKTSVVVELWTERDFELYLDNALLEAKPNPYGFIPFVIFPNLREPKKYWGVSDLPQIMESQRELNRAMSQLSRILELSGNPIAVLENVEESEDIAIRPGAVWNIPEDAKAYLLDLLQGGGINLHINYIDLIYRAMHDLSESPRSAFGGVERDMSGVALEIEMQPLLQKVRRKRIIRTAAYNRRNEMILKLLEKFAGEDFGNVGSGGHLRVVWGPVLPRDMETKVNSEQVMVQTGIHSRRTAMGEIGVADPDCEFRQWLEERESILKMNKELNARAGRNGARESAATSRSEGIEE